MTNDPKGTPAGPMPNQILNPKHQTDTNKPLLSSTIKQTLAQTVRELKQFSDPQLDAQWLVLKVLGKNEASWLLAHAEEHLTEPQEKALAEYVTRRRQGEPLAYIFGEWEFYGRPFTVNKAVLIPRPSTEQLVEHALDYLMKLSLDEGASTKGQLTVADIGTGSGCIAITLVLEMKKLARQKNIKFAGKIIATDVSQEALLVAQENAARYQVTDDIEFLHGDLLQPLQGKNIDLIVSNPPYVPTAELSWQQTNAKDKVGLRFEPRSALDGGEDGQRFIHQLVKTSRPLIYETLAGQIRQINLV